MAKPAKTIDTQAPRSAEDVVRASFEALGKRDLDGMKRYYDAEVVEDVVPVGILRGQSAVLAFFDGLFTAVPDLETSVGRVVAGDDGRVAVEWRMIGTFDGAPFQGIEPTGRRVDLRGFDLFEVRDGKIVSNAIYYDGAEFARQVGMLPSQDSGAERALKGAFNAVTKVRRTVGERTGS